MDTEIKRHHYADCIIAYAEGKTVEWSRNWGKWPTDWKDVNEPGFPGWNSAITFRIKPVVKEYWINIYHNPSTNIKWAGDLFQTKIEAMAEQYSEYVINLTNTKE